MWDTRTDPDSCSEECDFSITAIVSTKHSNQVFAACSPCANVNTRPLCLSSPTKQFQMILCITNIGPSLGSDVLWSVQRAGTLKDAVFQLYPPHPVGLCPKWTLSCNCRVLEVALRLNNACCPLRLKGCEVWPGHRSYIAFTTHHRHCCQIYMSPFQE